MIKEEKLVNELTDLLVSYARAADMKDDYVVGYLKGILHWIMDRLPEFYRGAILEQLNLSLDKIKTRMEAIPNDHHPR